MIYVFLFLLDSFDIGLVYWNEMFGVIEVILDVVVIIIYGIDMMLFIGVVLF